MNNVTNGPITRSSSRRIAASPKTTSQKLRTQTASKRAFEEHASTPKKQKISPNLNQIIKRRDAAALQAHLTSYSPSHLLQELAKDTAFLTSLSEADRIALEPLLVTTLLSSREFKQLAKACELLAKLPYREDECLELQVIHGRIEHIKENPKDYLKYSPNNRVKNNLLHIAAAAKQFPVFHLLTAMGLNSSQEDPSSAPPMLYLIQSIHQTPGSLNQYDDLFDAVYAPDQWRGQQRLAQITRALKEGICHNCLELVAYAKQKAGSDWNKILDRIQIPDHLKFLSIEILHYREEQPIEGFSSKYCPKGRNALHWAIALDYPVLIRALVETNLLSQTDRFGQYPLHLASDLFSVSNETLELIFNKAPLCVYYPDILGKTPFHYALERAFYAKLETLGSNRFIPVDLLDDPIVVALFEPRPNWNRLRFDAKVTKSGANALHFAVAFQNWFLIDTVLRTPGDWFQPDHLGWTPLSIAIVKGELTTVKTLVHAMQFDRDWWDHELLALHTAYEQAQQEIFHYLLSINPPKKVIDQLDQDGYSLLHLTSTRPFDTSYSKALLERCADPNIRGHHDFVPLQTAHPSHFELLIQYGANVNHAKNPFRQTPLHSVLFRGDYEGAKLLIKNGANPIAQDVHGNTPLGLHLQCQPSSSTITTFIIDIVRSNNILASEAWATDQLCLVYAGLLTNHLDELQILCQPLQSKPFKAAFNLFSMQFTFLNPEEWQDYLYALNEDHFQYKLASLPKDHLPVLNEWIPYLKSAPIEPHQHEKLLFWLGIIAQRKDYEGVPQDSQEKTDFYDRLERKLCEILSELRNVDASQQCEKLNSLYDTSRRCGGAWLFDTTEVASELNPALSGIPEQILQIVQNLQEHIVKEFAFGNVHQFFSHLIPLKEMIPSLAHDRPDLDRYAHPLDPEKVKRQFLRRYSPTQIIDTLLSELETRKPNLWITWLRSFVPLSEQDDYIDPFYDLDECKWTRRGAIELLVRSGILKRI